MKDSVLILAEAEDVHARSVATVLEREFSVPAIIWDSSNFPATDTVSFALTDDIFRFGIQSSNGNSIPLESLRSIWWRRPGRFKIDIADQRMREFCLNECVDFFRGTLASLRVPIINDPVAEAVASRKPLQLKAAQTVGLRIPKTVMTNDPEEIRVFWQELGGKCIYKAFTPPSWQIAETRMLTAESLSDLDKLRYAPIIVQEKIEKGLDVRINIFGERVFAASVTTHISAAELDWRLDLTATWEEHILPDGICQRLIALLRTLGLHYGCIDMRRQPDGEYVFLEVNPSGQFLFVEIDTDQPLVRSFAELLLRPDVIYKSRSAPG